MFLFRVNAQTLVASCFVSAALADIGSFYQYEGLQYSLVPSSEDSAPTTGVTDFNGTFTYTPGDTVTFSLGSFPLGSPAAAKSFMTVADLVPGVNGSDPSLLTPEVTNLARFIFSLDNDTTEENGIFVSPDLLPTIESYNGKINFTQNSTTFSADPNVIALFRSLNQTLSAIPEARNYLRRSIRGIRRFRDVKIPIYNNTTPYVLANIWRPISEGTFPPIVNVGAYGRRWNYGCECNPTELAKGADDEDVYFNSDKAGAPAGLIPIFPFLYFKRALEFRETISTTDWVPKGYVKILIDGPGVCNTPGVFNQHGLEEARAFKDSIEWAAVQPWSNGNVGIFGVSYWSIAAINVAALKPPSLKAIIPFFNDVDPYRDLVYNGGVLHPGGVGTEQCPGINSSIINYVLESPYLPFDTPEVYGPQGNLTIASNIANIEIPTWVSAPMEHPGIHVRGSSESYIQIPGAKRFSLVDGDVYGWPYDPEQTPRQVAFMDYFLKGKIDNGALDGPKVELQIRTGVQGPGTNREFFWSYHSDWPVPDTEYKKIYLSSQASPTLAEDAKGKPLYQMSFEECDTVDGSLTYNATLNTTEDCNISGAAFVTEPLASNVTLAGYMKVVTWISSTTDDADLSISITILQTNGTRIGYAIFTGYDDVPVGSGWLRVSERKEDPARSTEYRPFHTHTEEDYQPLTPGEPVRVEVEIWPGTAHINAGDRIRLDIQPKDSCRTPSPHIFNATYHDGAFNTLYVGPEHQSYLVIPSITANTDYSSFSA